MQNKLIFPVTGLDHKRGNPLAEIEVVLYGDFECQHCGELQPVLRKIQYLMGNKLHFVFRHFPIQRINQRAFNAALAAEAASKQNGFWEMHDLLYENQDALCDFALLNYALKIGIDTIRFRKDMNAKETVDGLVNCMINGVKSGVRLSPTLFLNGMEYQGKLDFDSLYERVNSAQAAGLFGGNKAYAGRGKQQLADDIHFGLKP